MPVAYSSVNCGEWSMRYNGDDKSLYYGDTFIIELHEIDIEELMEMFKIYLGPEMASTRTEDGGR